MEFTWSTFFLELINFLVLIWILNRLLYKPVSEAIDKRKQAIQKEIDTAKNLKDEAKKLESQYQTRLDDWQKEVETKRKQLEQELADLKEKELSDLKKQLEQVKTKQKAIDDQHLLKQKEEQLKESMNLATRFASKFLANFADKHLEEKIVTLFIDSLSTLSKDECARISTAFHKKTDGSAQVESCYPITKKHQEEIETKLSKIFGKTLTIHFQHKPELLAGLNITLGSIVIHSSLMGELEFFSEVAHGTAQE